MIAYSTCRDCGGLLHITNADNTVHPHCTPKPTRVERLAQQWLAAIKANDEQTAHNIDQLITQLDGRPPRLLDAAVQYATKYKWPVFPLRPGEKRPATRNGFKDATIDPERITAWWTRHPDSNIGLPTGHAFDVIDVDLPDGIQSLIELQAQDNDVHGRVSTSSGGVHFYITPTGDGNATRFMPGVDYRGRGGYVVAPPSTLAQHGRAWTWAHHPSPVITKVGDLYAG